MKRLQETVETVTQADMPFLQDIGLRHRKKDKEKDKVYDPFQIMKIAADVVAKLRGKKGR
jgi:hypothetical protein